MLNYFRDFFEADVSPSHSLKEYTFSEGKASGDELAGDVRTHWTLFSC